MTLPCSARCALIASKILRVSPWVSSSRLNFSRVIASGGAPPRQVNPHKAADRLTVIQRVLHPFAGQPEALLVLGHVHAQHPRQANRRAPPAFTLRIERFDLGLQRRPRRCRVDPGKKAVTPRQLLLGGVHQVGKARLHRSGALVKEGRKDYLVRARVAGRWGVNQRFHRLHIGTKIYFTDDQGRTCPSRIEPRAKPSTYRLTSRSCRRLQRTSTYRSAQ